MTIFILYMNKIHGLYFSEMCSYVYGQIYRHSEPSGSGIQFATSAGDVQNAVMEVIVRTVIVLTKTLSGGERSCVCVCVQYPQCEKSRMTAYRTKFLPIEKRKMWKLYMNKFIVIIKIQTLVITIIIKTKIDFLENSFFFFYSNIAHIA